MRPSNAFESLLSRSLRNLFSAETQRIRAARRIASGIHEETLRETLSSQAAMGEWHLARLDLVAHRHRIALTEKGAAGMAGIIAMTDDLDSDTPSPFMADLYHAGIFRRSSSYLRASYRSALSLADRPGWSHAVASLEANLAEEEEADSRLAVVMGNLLRQADPSSSRRSTLTFAVW